MVAAVVWASRFESLPPAEFSFQNGTDPKTLDPHRATGQPENRILRNLFTGLLQLLPEGPPDPATGVQRLTPQPGVAESVEVGDDRLTYTFRLRPDAVWTDGRRITAEDFVWSWRRMLHPETACEYNFLLFAVPGAEKYAGGIVDVGDRVEVELWDRPGETNDGEANYQNFPRGTMVYGTLREVRSVDPPRVPDGMKKLAAERLIAAAEARTVFVVETVDVDDDGRPLWDRPATTRSFTRDPSSPLADEATERTHAVLVAFGADGDDAAVRAVDDRTLVVRLDRPVPYFDYLMAYNPLCPVPRHVVERYGKPMWTKPEHIVSNGPYRLGLRRLRDRVRLVKNDRWFDADNVSLRSIDALSVESQNTALNMYETGEIDWVTDPPVTLMEELVKRDDFIGEPILGVYYYELNTKRPPLDDPRVRRALALAINRRQITEEVTKAGQPPAGSIVPPGIAGYEPPEGLTESAESARALLAEAGYPGGRGFPKFTVLYNTSEAHRSIAEVIQQQWKNTLNIQIELQNMEWGSFLDKRQQRQYDISRAAWIADYPDPNTFLDLWLADSPQNNTNWSDERFETLMASAEQEANPDRRMRLLAEAEAVFVREVPAIPIYFYVGINLVKPRVKGLAPTPRDLHPLQLLSVD